MFVGVALNSEVIPKAWSVIKYEQEPWRLPSRQAEFDETDRLSLMCIVIIRQ